MGAPETDLEKTRRQVRAGSSAVFHLRQLIADLRTAGHQTKDAERRLADLEGMQGLREDRLAELERRQRL